VSGAWVVINLGRSYSGIEIEQGEGFRPTKIKVPFGDVASAWHAISELDMSVIEDNPVIAGTIEKEDHDEEDSDSSAGHQRALPGADRVPG
jgi:hypothetical protein